MLTMGIIFVALGAGCLYIGAAFLGLVLLYIGLLIIHPILAFAFAIYSLWDRHWPYINIKGEL